MPLIPPLLQVNFVQASTRLKINKEKKEEKWTNVFACTLKKYSLVKKGAIPSSKMKIISTCYISLI